MCPPLSSRPQFKFFPVHLDQEGVWICAETNPYAYKESVIPHTLETPG